MRVDELAGHLQQSGCLLRSEHLGPANPRLLGLAGKPLNTVFAGLHTLQLAAGGSDGPR